MENRISTFELGNAYVRLPGTNQTFKLRNVCISPLPVDDYFEEDYLFEKNEDMSSNFKQESDETMEAVNHPKHYESESGLEVIDVIDSFTSDLNGMEGFYVGNIIKYVCRYNKKNGIEDLEKAEWYIHRLILLKKNLLK